MPLRPCVLVSLVTVACSSGGTRGNTASSASIGEATGDSATGDAGTDNTATDDTATPGVDTSASMGTDSATSAPDPSAGTTDASGDESTGGPAPSSCADDPAACNAWFLPPGATQWEAITIGGPAALAPTGPVLAAFDIEGPRVGFVVTADELVRVDLEQRTWETKTALADRFPQINVDIFSAYSIPAYWNDEADGIEGVTIAGSDVAFLYGYDVEADEFVFDVGTAFGDSWTEPGAPVLTDVREMWLDLTNAEGWAAQDVSQVCPDASGPVGPNIAVVTDDAVQVLDAGHCFAFFPPVAYATYEPMGLPGAPAADRIGGVAYNETTGLVVFAVD